MNEFKSIEEVEMIYDIHNLLRTCIFSPEYDIITWGLCYENWPQQATVNTRRGFNPFKYRNISKHFKRHQCHADNKNTIESKNNQNTDFIKKHQAPPPEDTKKPKKHKYLLDLSCKKYIKASSYYIYPSNPPHNNYKIYNKYPGGNKEAHERSKY